MRKIITLFILISLWGCKGTNCNMRIALFFNPSSLKQSTYHFTALTGKQAIVDTSLKSTHIDQSVLIKCFDADQVTSLTRIVSLDSILKIDGPTSVFIHYDDRIKLDMLFESYTKKSIKATGRIPVYKEFVDSLTTHKSATNKFDSLMIYIKKISAGVTDVIFTSSNYEPYLKRSFSIREPGQSAGLCYLS